MSGKWDYVGCSIETEVSSTYRGLDVAKSRAGGGSGRNGRKKKKTRRGGEKRWR